MGKGMGRFQVQVPMGTKFTYQKKKKKDTPLSFDVGKCYSLTTHLFA